MRERQLNKEIPVIVEKYKKSQNTRDFLLCTVVGAQRVTKIRLRARVGSFFSRARSIDMAAVGVVGLVSLLSKFFCNETNECVSFGFLCRMLTTSLSPVHVCYVKPVRDSVKNPNDCVFQNIRNVTVWIPGLLITGNFD